MSYDPNNIFAKILRGEIPCTKLHDSAHTIAFRDLYPKAPVHILVIPKGAYENANDFGANASPEEVADFWRAVASIVKQENLEAGYRLIANTGVNGGQEVPHFHLHILAGEKLGPMRGR